MQRKSFSGMRCSVAQCLEVAGEWWSMLVVRDAFRPGALEPLVVTAQSPGRHD